MTKNKLCVLRKLLTSQQPKFARISDTFSTDSRKRKQYKQLVG